MKPRTLFTMPWNGSSSALNVKPTPIVETSTGKKIDAAQVAAAEDRAGQQQREREAEDDLRRRR